MRLKAVKLLVLVILLGALASCATLGLKSWSTYTPKERALAILDAYNGQYADTLDLATMPNPTDAQRAVVRTKKGILKEVYPLIEIYVSTVESGKVPSQASEQKILNLLNRLGTKIGG